MKKLIFALSFCAFAFFASASNPVVKGEDVKKNDILSVPLQTTEVVSKISTEKMLYNLRVKECVKYALTLGAEENALCHLIVVTKHGLCCFVCDFYDILMA